MPGFSSEKRRASLCPDRYYFCLCLCLCLCLFVLLLLLLFMLLKLLLFLFLTFFSHNLPPGHLRLPTAARPVVEPHSANRERTR